MNGHDIKVRGLVVHVSGRFRGPLSNPFSNGAPGRAQSTTIRTAESNCRVNPDVPFDWNTQTLTASTPEAGKLLKREYRKGWEVAGT